jgi:hypothetical protein
LSRNIDKIPPFLKDPDDPANRRIVQVEVLTDLLKRVMVSDVGGDGKRDVLQQ